MRILNWETRYGRLETYPYKPKDCVFLKQIHSADFINVDNQTLMGSTKPFGEADGFLCQSSVPPAFDFAIQTADCIPALIEGDKGWAFLHLGWRGLALKMPQDSRVQELSVTHLWIGPHISLESYEVSQDFTKNFPTSDNFHRAYSKLYFDLQKELIDQVQSFAPKAQVQESSFCTFHHQRLNSFRANATKERNWTIFTNKSS